MKLSTFIPSQRKQIVLAFALHLGMLALFFAAFGAFDPPSVPGT